MLTGTREAVVVLNTGSRAAGHEAARVRRLLHDRGITVRAFDEVCDHDEVVARLRSHCERGITCAIVGGGDGTMTNAVEVLAHTKTALAAIPLGTGNSFAASIGIDSVEAAIDAVAAGRIRAIDVGVVNGRRFANFATIGLSSRIADRSPKTLKHRLGPLAYVIAAARPILRARTFTAKIDGDDGRLMLATQDIIVANGRYFGKTAVAPDARIDDGYLALYTRESHSRLDAVMTYLGFGAKLHNRLPGAHTLRSHAFTVKTKKKQPIAIDGEVIGKTPARFTLERDALLVYTPS